MIVSSRTAFCIAANTSTGTAHHTGARPAAATVVFTPIARATTYNPSPGMPTRAAKPAPIARSGHGRRRSSPSRLVDTPSRARRCTASATGTSATTIRVT
ncbi:hypothetical protein KEM60_02962 [Austwickia sp. TVS 96-490-7B]|nr:hypothetical protein [Austwickia sp. TVS 96-490-7B]